MSDCFSYLDHHDKPDKFQYDDSLIVCDDLAYWQGLKKGDTEERVLNIVDDLIAHVPYRELVRRYGRDIVINYNKYWEFSKRVYHEERIFDCMPVGMTCTKIDVYQPIVFDDIVEEGI